MKILKYALISVICITVFVILIISSRSKKAFKYIFLNAFLGVSVFFLLYFTKKFTGIVLALNFYTLVGSALFGIPAVILFLVLNLIF